MICILSGPSCAGKSILLQSSQLGAFTGIALSNQLVFPADIVVSGCIPDSDCFVHYNTLRATDRVVRTGNIDRMDSDNFQTDGPWREICCKNADKFVIVLVASAAVLRDRMLSRRYIEPHLGATTPEAYSSEHWTRVLDSIDLLAHYKNWIKEICRNNIEYCLVNSMDTSYRVIDHDRLDSLLR